MADITPQKAEFKNLREVAEYLKAEGWKASQSTIYKHAKEGRLRPDAEGIYNLKTIIKYAGIHLKRVTTAQKEKTDKLAEEKQREEVRKIRIQADREEIKLQRERGEVVDIADWDLATAARASYQVALLRAMTFSKASGAIHVCNGEEGKIGDMVRYFNEWIDEFMNECATIKEIQVVFKANVIESS